MSKKWYVVHTYSGYENKVKSAIEEKVKTLGKADLFGEVLVPTEKVVGMVKGVKKSSSRKFFPGYILVNMELTDEAWHILHSIPKLTGFVGGSNTPPPVSEEDVKPDKGKLRVMVSIFGRATPVELDFVQVEKA